MLPIHPDDILLFTEICAAMRRVAIRYDLPLRSITHLPMPAEGMVDRFGDCNGSGDIRLVLRQTVEGAWCDEPMNPNDVWDTAAHELAHLRHMNHGIAFQEFRLELKEAMANREEDHKERLLRKLVKMQRQRDGEAAIGNTAAAEAFAAAINRMLIENELNPTDIDYAAATDADPVVEIPVNLGAYKIDHKSKRVAWQETLARVVAKQHLCTFLIRTGTNQITFVGTRSHATVAEYVYGILVPAADKMSTDALRDFRIDCRRNCGYTRTGGFPELYGYRESWLTAFVKRIAERLQEARDAVVAESKASAPPEVHSQALMRLSGALQKAKKYTDDKYETAGRSLYLKSGSNSNGTAAGRIAADRMPIGRRGINQPATRGLLGGK